MDYIKEELDAFKESAKRMRWFMITALLISVLIVLHTYLEKFSFQEQQLRTLFSKRMASYSEEVSNCYEELAKYAQLKKDKLKADPPLRCNNDFMPPRILDQIMENQNSYEKVLDEYASIKFGRIVADNTLKDTKMQIRNVPLLGVSVPANDFVIVMALMSLMFVGGTWLNLRAVGSSLTALKRHGDLNIIKLAKLHTVFLTDVETTREHLLARAIRSFVFWIPFYSILLATILGYWDVFRNLILGGRLHFGSMSFVLFSLAFSGVVILLHLYIALECKHQIKNIDSILTTPIQENHDKTDCS